MAACKVQGLLNESGCAKPLRFGWQMGNNSEGVRHTCMTISLSLLISAISGFHRGPSQSLRSLPDPAPASPE